MRFLLGICVGIWVGGCLVLGLQVYDQFHGITPNQLIGILIWPYYWISNLHYLVIR